MGGRALARSGTVGWWVVSGRWQQGIRIKFAGGDAG